MEFSEWLAEWGWTLIAIPFTAVFLIIITLAISTGKQQKEKEQKEREERERLQRLLVSNSPIKDYMPSKTIKGIFSLDYSHQKWRPEFFENCKPYGFDEIAGFELIENDVVISSSNTQTRGGVSRALAGGLIAGDVGALVGASTAGTHTDTVSKKEISSRKVRISLTNKEVNQIIIDIPLKMIKQSSVWGDRQVDYETEVLDQKGEIYKINSEGIAQEVISLLESAVSIASKNSLTQIDNNADSIIEEIKKYKELLDNGIISEDEFIKKKQQLMNI